MYDDGRIKAVDSFLLEVPDVDGMAGRKPHVRHRAHPSTVPAPDRPNRPLRAAVGTSEVPTEVRVEVPEVSAVVTAAEVSGIVAAPVLALVVVGALVESLVISLREALVIA